MWENPRKRPKLWLGNPIDRKNLKRPLARGGPVRAAALSKLSVMATDGKNLQSQIGSSLIIEGKTSNLKGRFMICPVTKEENLLASFSVLFFHNFEFASMLSNSGPPPSFGPTGRCGGIIHVRPLNHTHEWASWSVTGK